MELAFRRDRARQDIINDLIAGRRTLPDAAHLLHALGPQPEHYLASLRQRYPGKSDGECLCREVIRWVRIELGDTEQAAAVVARLEAELQDCRNSVTETGVTKAPPH